MFDNILANLRYYCALLRCIGTRTAQVDDSRWPPYQWILGHRGARSIAPENTLSSFRMAMAYGADGVEFDVIPSSEGIPMVIHDDTLERTTDGQGIIWHHDSSTLANLDATKLSSGFAKEGIPSLKATLHVLPDGALTNIELKNRGHLSIDQFIECIEREINPHKDRLRILVSSFDANLLKFLRERKVSYLLALCLSKRDVEWHQALKIMHEIKPDALHVTFDLATPLACFLAHRAHMRIAIWTINNPQQAKQLFSRIDGIFTDYVQEIVQALRPKLVSHQDRSRHSHRYHR